MEKGFKVLQDSISVSIDNLKFVAENTTGNNGLLLNSVIDTLQGAAFVPSLFFYR